MEKAFGDMNYLEVLTCLDGIIMFGRALENNGSLDYWITWEIDLNCPLTNARPAGPQ